MRKGFFGNLRWAASTDEAIEAAEGGVATQQSNRRKFRKPEDTPQVPYEGELCFPIRQHWEKVALARQAKRPCVLGEEGSGAKWKKARRR